MIAMPYILVNIVLHALVLAFFCLTTAALLARYPATALYLPTPLRRHRAVALMAHAVVLAALSTVVVRTIGPARRYAFDVFLCVGFVNSVVLIYAFLDKRYVLAMPRVRRRLLIAVCSVVMTAVPVVAVIAAVFMLFVIR
jgi:hypothetical protein